MPACAASDDSSRGTPRSSSPAAMAAAKAATLASARSLSAADAIRAAGGEALPLLCDIRDEAQVERAVEEAVAAFGGIDICINNASAIRLTGILDTAIKRYDLMHSVNGAARSWSARNAFLTC